MSVYNHYIWKMEQECALVVTKLLKTKWWCKKPQVQSKQQLKKWLKNGVQLISSLSCPSVMDNIKEKHPKPKSCAHCLQNRRKWKQIYSRTPLTKRKQISKEGKHMQEYQQREEKSQIHEVQIIHEDISSGQKVTRIEKHVISEVMEKKQRIEQQFSIIKTQIKDDVSTWMTREIKQVQNWPTITKKWTDDPASHYLLYLERIMSVLAKPGVLPETPLCPHSQLHTTALEKEMTDELLKNLVETCLDVCRSIQMWQHSGFEDEYKDPWTRLLFECVCPKDECLGRFLATKRHLILESLVASWRNHLSQGPTVHSEKLRCPHMKKSNAASHQHLTSLVSLERNYNSHVPFPVACSAESLHLEWAQGSQQDVERLRETCLLCFYLFAACRCCQGLLQTFPLDLTFLTSINKEQKVWDKFYSHVQTVLVLQPLLVAHETGLLAQIADHGFEWKCFKLIHDKPRIGPKTQWELTYVQQTPQGDFLRYKTRLNCCPLDFHWCLRANSDFLDCLNSWGQEQLDDLNYYVERGAPQRDMFKLLENNLPGFKGDSQLKDSYSVVMDQALKLPVA